MYKFTLTEGIMADVRRIEKLKKEIDAQGPLPRVWVGRTRRDLEAEAAAASTMLEGVAVTVDEARRILAGDRPAGVTTEDANLVDGYRNAMRLVPARADAPEFECQSELLLAIHHAVLAGSYANGAGRFREKQNWLTSRETGDQVYLPPPPEKVAELVDGLAAWLNASTEPAPVVAALAHVSLAGIHPFRDGNGRTARILASLAMYRGGYRAPQFTSLEEWWGRHAEQYYRSFDCLGSTWDPDADVTPFVAAHIRAQATQVRALELRNATERALWTVLEDIAVHDLGLHERTTHALYDAFFAREVTNRFYRNVAEVSDVTAAHDLAKLVASGLLQAKGAGRGARYLATPHLFRTAVRDADLESTWFAEGASLQEQSDLALAGLAARLHGSARGRD